MSQAASVRGHRRPWAVAVVDVVVGAIAVLMWNDPFFSVVAWSAILTMAIVGAVLMTRAPGNRVGALLLAAGTLEVASFAFGGYGIAAMGRGGWAGAAVPMASLLNDVLSLYPIVMLLIGIPLIFPDGHLLGPRWRVVAWLTVAAMAAMTINKVFMPGPVGPAAAENPLGIAGAVPTLQLFNSFASLTAPVGFGAAAAAVAIRFRRGRGIERQQLKWFLAVVAVSAVAFLVAIFAGSGPVADAAFVMAFCGLVALPVAIAIAILRYRLYEIDRLVSRTISYAVITGGLIVVFLAVNLTLTSAFGAATNENALVVAVSTLVVAALFTPLRRRVQAIVDRRFDRARYDGEHTATAFSHRLRGDVDLASVAADLDSTVRAAIAPTAVSVWLRKGPA